MIRIYIGKSGAGKDTLLNRDVKNGRFERVVSYTTRPIRDGEQNGIDYHFVNEDEFFGMTKSPAKLAEYRFYETLVGGRKATWYYGSPLLDPKKNYVVVLDITGAKEYLARYGAESIELVYITVPDDVRENRAKKRGSFDQTEWDRRAKDDAIKFSAKAIAELESIYGRKIKVIDNSKESNNQKERGSDVIGYEYIMKRENARNNVRDRNRSKNNLRAGS